MRDVLVMALVLAGAVAALRRPWIGVILWNWVSLMNPHRYTYGFAYDAPVAAIAAVSTLIGFLATRDRHWPFRGAAPVFLLVFLAWLTLSWSLGVDPSDDYEQWTKVMKVDVMIFVALSLLRTKLHVFCFVWVCAGSLALLGAKGGVFTVMNGGNFHVWGPPGSFIEDNNNFALALVMTIPLVRFLQMQCTSRLARHGLTGVMMLLAASALGSQSRGALLAIGAMTGLMWWRGRNKLISGVTIVLVGTLLIGFMPDSWTSRMETINTYDTDDSALGRLSAWSVAWNLALHRPLGVGFNAARPEFFEKYSSAPELGTPAAHSIYFQVLGNHGFVGLLLFVGMLFATLRAAGQVRKEAARHPEAKWCGELAGMAQVSLIGYAVGGAFLSLAYFDLPYDIIVMVMVTHTWVRSKAWEREPADLPGWRTVPGLASSAAGH